MTILKSWWKAATICAIVSAASLTGCSAEYHGYDSDIDGVLWRQVASFEDPLSRQIYDPIVNEPDAYLDAIGGARWDGSEASTAELNLEDGGVVLYDLSSTGSTVELSVFISSGPRSDGPTDSGRSYNGPCAVFTCYGYRTQLLLGEEPRVTRVIFDECPAVLVNTAPHDAAFASGEVFDG